MKGGGAAAERLRGVLSDRLGPEPDAPEQGLFSDFQSISRTMLLRLMLTTLRRIASANNGVPSLDPNRTYPIRLGGEEGFDLSLDADGNLAIVFIGISFIRPTGQRVIRPAAAAGRMPALPGGGPRFVPAAAFRAGVSA